MVPAPTYFYAQSGDTILGAKASDTIFVNGVEMANQATNVGTYGAGVDSTGHTDSFASDYSSVTVGGVTVNAAVGQYTSDPIETDSDGNQTGGGGNTGPISQPDIFTNHWRKPTLGGPPSPSPTYDYNVPWYYKVVDPLILNLTGGVTLTTSVTGGAYFDDANTGFQQATAWARPWARNLGLQPQRREYHQWQPIVRRRYAPA